MKSVLSHIFDCVIMKEQTKICDSFNFLICLRLLYMKKDTKKAAFTAFFVSIAFAM